MEILKKLSHILSLLELELCKNGRTRKDQEKLMILYERLSRLNAEILSGQLRTEVSLKVDREVMSILDSINRQNQMFSLIGPIGIDSFERLIERIYEAENLCRRSERKAVGQPDHISYVESLPLPLEESVAPEVRVPKRYFATRIEGGPEAAGGNPRLLVGKKYDCVFSVKAEIDPTVGIASEIPAHDLAMMLERQVKVMAVGNGLEIRNGIVPLVVSHDYTSIEAAVNFNAFRPGPFNLQLCLMLDLNVVRMIQYDFLAVQTLGTIDDATPSAATCEWPKIEEYNRLRKQKLQISVSNKAFEELELHFIWGTDSTVLLPLKTTTLLDMESRKAKFLSKYRNSIQHVRTAELSKKAAREFLADIKHLGDWIFQSLFIRTSRQGLPKIGKMIQELLQSNHPAPIQINSGLNPLPWMFLSDGVGALGLRHGVEMIPSGMLSTELDLRHRPLRMVCGVAPAFKNVMLDDGRSVVDVQTGLFNALAKRPDRFDVVLAADEQQWLGALQSPADVIYAYCHGSSNAGAGRLWMTHPANAISDTTIASSNSIDWSRHPLVILAACTSAAIDPFRAIGLASPFMANGARGYIGVEGEVPSTFASLFMERFFEDFFMEGNMHVGEVLFGLRSQFLEQMNNPWGILFAQYCRSEMAFNQQKEVELW